MERVFFFGGWGRKVKKKFSVPVSPPMKGEREKKKKKGPFPVGPIEMPLPSNCRICPDRRYMAANFLLESSVSDDFW